MIKDFFGFMGLMLLVGIIIFSPIVAVAIWADAETCDNKATQMQLEHKWYVFGGCMIKYQGKWIPINKLKIIEIN